MQKPYCVTFAGVPGTSKSIVAHYLSERFGLPIFSNDNLRYEVREDMLADNINIPEVLAEFERRSTERQEWILAQGKPFIRDASVDRAWPRFKKQLERTGYDWFIIDMELSQEFITALFQKTARPRSIGQLPGYVAQHQAFMAAYGDEIALKITDETFARRNELAEEALRVFIGDKA